MPRQKPGRKRELEVEPTRVAVHVEHFPSEIKSRHQSGFHRLPIHLLQRDSPRRHHRLAEAAEILNHERKILQKFQEGFARFFGHFPRFHFRRKPFRTEQFRDETVREPKLRADQIPDFPLGVFLKQSAQRRVLQPLGKRQVKFIPGQKIPAEVQNSRAGKTVVGEKYVAAVLGEFFPGPPKRHERFRKRDPGTGRERVRLHRHGRERRAKLDKRKAESLREDLAVARGTRRGKRFSADRTNEFFGLKRPARARFRLENRRFFVSAQGRDFLAAEELNAGVFASLQQDPQHIARILGTGKNLPVIQLDARQTPRRQKRHQILIREVHQRRLHKTGLSRVTAVMGAKVGDRPGVRDVAPPASRDEELPARLRHFLDQKDFLPVSAQIEIRRGKPRRAERRHEPRRSRAQDQDVRPFFTPRGFQRIFHGIPLSSNGAVKISCVRSSGNSGSYFRPTRWYFAPAVRWYGKISTR